MMEEQFVKRIRLDLHTKRKNNPGLWGVPSDKTAVVATQPLVFPPQRIPVYTKRIRYSPLSKQVLTTTIVWLRQGLAKTIAVAVVVSMLIEPKPFFIKASTTDNNNNKKYFEKVFCTVASVVTSLAPLHESFPAKWCSLLWLFGVIVVMTVSESPNLGLIRLLPPLLFHFV